MFWSWTESSMIIRLLQYLGPDDLGEPAPGVNQPREWNWHQRPFYSQSPFYSHSWITPRLLSGIALTHDYLLCAMCLVCFILLNQLLCFLVLNCWITCNHSVNTIDFIYFVDCCWTISDLIGGLLQQNWETMNSISNMPNLWALHFYLPWSETKITGSPSRKKINFAEEKIWSANWSDKKISTNSLPEARPQIINGLSLIGSGIRFRCII